MNLTPPVNNLVFEMSVRIVHIYQCSINASEFLWWRIIWKQIINTNVEQNEWENNKWAHNQIKMNDEKICSYDSISVFDNLNAKPEGQLNDFPFWNVYSIWIWCDKWSLEVQFESSVKRIKKRCSNHWSVHTKIVSNVLQCILNVFESLL